MRQGRWHKIGNDGGKFEEENRVLVTLTLACLTLKRVESHKDSVSTFFVNSHFFDSWTATDGIDKSVKRLPTDAEGNSIDTVDECKKFDQEWLETQKKMDNSHQVAAKDFMNYLKHKTCVIHVKYNRLYIRYT